MKSKLLVTSIVTVLALSACATVPGGFQADKGRVAKASIVGCAGGALLAKFTGNSDNALKACAGGAVVAGVASYTAQLKEAKAVEEAARQAGLNVQVQTQEVVQGAERKSELKELRLQYDPNDLRNPSAETAAVFDKLASLLHRFGWAETVVIGDKLDLSTVNATLVVYHFEVSGLGFADGSIR